MLLTAWHMLLFSWAAVFVFFGLAAISGPRRPDAVAQARVIVWAYAARESVEA